MEADQGAMLGVLKTNVSPPGGDRCPRAVGSLWQGRWVTRRWSQTSGRCDLGVSVVAGRSVIGGSCTMGLDDRLLTRSRIRWAACGLWGMELLSLVVGLCRVGGSVLRSWARSVLRVISGSAAFVKLGCRPPPEIDHAMVDVGLMVVRGAL